MNVYAVLKIIAGTIAGSGAGAIVGNLIHSTTPEDISKYQRVLTGVGSFVLTGIASKVAYEYVTNEMDERFPKKKAEEIAWLTSEIERLQNQPFTEENMHKSLALLKMRDELLGAPAPLEV